MERYELAGWWWNGKTGQLVSRMIWLHRNGSGWRLTAVQGEGGRAKYFSRDHDSENAAMAEIRAMIARTGESWRDLWERY